MLCDKELILALRSHLQPKGTLPVVMLSLNSFAFFNKEFVDKCIDEVEGIVVKAKLGEPVSSLEQLALHVLMDSSSIQTK